MQKREFSYSWVIYRQLINLSLEDQSAEEYSASVQRRKVCKYIKRK